MKKQIWEVKICEDTVNEIGIHRTEIVEELEVLVYAEDDADGEQKAISIFRKELEDYGGDPLYLDDLRHADIGEEKLFFEMSEQWHKPADKGITVGELKKILEGYNDDMEINIVSDTGLSFYRYSALKKNDIVTESSRDDDWEKVYAH